MKLLKFVLFLMTALGASSVMAAELGYHSEEKQSRSFIGFGLDNSSFTVNGATIKGFGGHVDFGYNIDNKVSFMVFLSSAINTENSVSSSFTGFGGFAYYSVLGSCCQSEKMTSIAGSPLVTETRQQENILNVGLGFDQYMLYGTSSVYPASGLGFAVNYIFSIWNRKLKAEVKQSNLNLGGTKINGLTISLSILLPL